MGNIFANTQIPRYTLTVACLACCLLLLPFAATAQDKVSKKAMEYYNQAREHAQWDRFAEAEAALLKAIQEQPDFVTAHEQLGYLYFNTEKYADAKNSFNRMVQLAPDKSKEVYYYLAKSSFYVLQLDSAQQYLNHYRTIGAINDKRKAELDKLERNIAFAKGAVKNPAAFTPKPAGEGVNTEYFEYFPVLTADGQWLYFTRRAQEPTTKRLQEDIMVSQRINGGWGNAVSISPNVNTPDVNQGAHSISPDGRSLYFTICEGNGGYGGCDIYVSKRVGDTWGKPKNLGPVINTQHKETQPCISSDGRSLYFVSSRPGGLGMLDIWVSHLNVDGQWGQPINLGPTINTPEVDERPYIHPDGQTLYFSSEGWPGFGSTDIYVSRRVADTWGEPQNLGYPINSYAYEGGVFVSLTGDTGYFATNRFSGKTDLDIYAFEIPAAARPKLVTYVSGTVKDKSTGKVILPQIEFIDLKTGLPTNLIMPDAQTGEFLLTLPVGSDYALNINEPGYLFYSYNFPVGKQGQSQKLDIVLEPITSKKTVVLNNVFYETGLYKLKAESKTELDRLLRFLQANPTIKLEVSGHTDNVGADASNLDLSQKRANEVVNYLVAAGIDKARLKAKGYGATMPIADNGTEEGRAKNRRTEIMIVD